MRVEIEDFKTGWYGIALGIRADEIDVLIERLKLIKKEQQHFHIASDYEGEGGIGDIEIYLLQEDERNNMAITSPAITPTR
jgi:hypothetical protein